MDPRVLLGFGEKIVYNTRWYMPYMRCSVVDRVQAHTAETLHYPQQQPQRHYRRMVYIYILYMGVHVFNF